MKILNKKLVVVITITLFALNLLTITQFAAAQPVKIDVYAGESIQEHINQANNGDTVIVHEGIYQEMVSIGNTITVIGKGAIIQTPDWIGIYIHGTAAKVTGFQIQPLNNGVDHQFGIYIDGPNSTATGNEISSGFTTAAITVQGPSGILIKNNVIQSDTSGIIAVITETVGVPTGEETITITDNQIFSGTIGTEASAIWVNSLHGSAIIKGNFIRAQGYGVTVVSAPTGCKVNGNNIVVGDGFWGIVISASTKVTANNNVIENSFATAGAIAIDGSDDVTVRQNQINTAANSISLYGVTNGVVTENEIHNRNQQADIGNYGIAFNAVSDCKATYNKVYGGQIGMLAFFSARVTFANNMLAPSDPNGFNQGLMGIWLFDVADSKLSENKIVGPNQNFAYAGINLQGASTNNHILRNEISGQCSNPWMFGIFLQSETSANFVKNNYISGADTKILDGSGLNNIVL
jgi:hypothetical protein